MRSRFVLRIAAVGPDDSLTAHPAAGSGDAHDGRDRVALLARGDRSVLVGRAGERVSHVSRVPTRKNQRPLDGVAFLAPRQPRIDMGYHVVDPDELEPSSDHPCDRRSIAEAAELAQLAAAVYEIEPGEQLSTTYHYHEQREELFYVIDGTLSVETPDRTYTVDAGSVFVAEPESPIRPYNPEAAGAPVRVLGVGAPPYDIGRPYDPDAT